LAGRPVHPVSVGADLVAGEGPDQDQAPRDPVEMIEYGGADCKDPRLEVSGILGESPFPAGFQVTLQAVPIHRGIFSVKVEGLSLKDLVPFMFGQKCRNGLAVGAGCDVKSMAEPDGDPDILVPFLFAHYEYLAPTDQAEQGGAARFLGQFHQKGRHNGSVIQVFQNLPRQKDQSGPKGVCLCLGIFYHKAEPH
jgi:hypothetical protein